MSICLLAASDTPHGYQLPTCPHSTGCVRCSGQGNGPFVRSLLIPEVSIMNVDAFHAAFGLTFTFVWLIVGQIIVDGR